MMKIQAFFDRLDDYMNPLVVKDLRQSSRNKSLMIALHVFLAFLLFMLIVIFGNGRAREDGSTMLVSFLGILLMATMFFVPIYSGVRLALERMSDNMELLYITTLEPHRIVRGKFLAGLMLVILFYSAAMPFLSLTYFLRGVDLPTILLAAGFTFMVVITILQAALCLASLVRNRAILILLGLAAGMPMMTFYGMVIRVIDLMIDKGMGFRFINGEMWPEITAFLVIDLFILGSLYKLNTAFLKPASMDRAKPVRTFVLFGWLLIMGGLCFKLESEPVALWSFFGLVMGLLGMLFACSERDRPGLRIMQERPVGKLKRVSGFVFSSGAAGGFAWSLLFISISLVFLMLHNNATAAPDDKIVSVMIGRALYGVCYILLAHQIHVRIFKRFTSKLVSLERTWITAIVLIVSAVVLSLLTVELLGGFSYTGSDPRNLVMLPNPIILVNDHFRQVALYFLVFCFSILFVLEFRWWVSRFRQYVSGEEPAS